MVCSRTNGHVIALHLVKNNLTGNIWNITREFRYLHGLCLGNNRIVGRLDQIFSSLASTAKYLLRLDLRSNKITGKIPGDKSTLETFKNLAELQLPDNRGIKGKLPYSIDSLKSLQVLNIGHTGIRGEIPNSINRLHHLWFLDMHNLGLEGNLKQFENMTRLLNLRLFANKIEGVIPKHIDKFFPNLEEFSVQNNQLSGKIPEALGHLRNLKHFIVGGNKLIGRIPKSFRFLTKLESFIMYRTDLEGFEKGEKEKDRFQFNSSRLSQFNAYMSTSFKCSVKNLIHALWPSRDSLMLLTLWGTKFRGSLKSELFRFTKLTTIKLSSCRLQGGLVGPTPVVGTENMHLQTWIDLSNNDLKGAIPASFGNLQVLYFLDITGNRKMRGKIDLRFLMPTYNNQSDVGDSERHFCPKIRFCHTFGEVRMDPEYYDRKYCFCKPGYFGQNGACVSCMEGGTCHGFQRDSMSNKDKNSKHKENNVRYVEGCKFRGQKRIMAPPFDAKMIMKVGYWPFPTWRNVEKLIRCPSSKIKSPVCNPKANCSCHRAEVINKTGRQSFMIQCDKKCICSKVHGGRFCSNCAEGFYSDGPKCYECPGGRNKRKQIIIISMSMILLFSLTAASVSLSEQRRKIAVAAAAIELTIAGLLCLCAVLPLGVIQLNILILFLAFGYRRKFCSGLIKTGFFYIQVLDSFITSSNIWPEIAYDVHSYVSGTFNLHFNSLGCYIPELFTPLGRLLSLMFFPVVIIGMVSSGFVIWRRTYARNFPKDSVAKAKLKCRYLCLIFLNLSYFPIIMSILSILAPCRTEDKLVFMANYPWLDCGTKMHSILIIIAAMAVPMYVLGIPLGVFLPLLYKNRHEIHEDHNEDGDDRSVSAWLGFLYHAFKPKFRIYMTVLLMLRLFIIATALKVIPSHSESQTVTISVTLLVFLIFQALFRPFSGPPSTEIIQTQNVAAPGLCQENSEDVPDFHLADDPPSVSDYHSANSRIDSCPGILHRAPGPKGNRFAVHGGTTQPFSLENALETSALSVLLFTFMLLRVQMASSESNVSFLLNFTLILINTIFVIGYVCGVFYRLAGVFGQRFVRKMLEWILLAFRFVQSIVQRNARVGQERNLNLGEPLIEEDTEL